MSWHINGPINPGATVTLTYTADVPPATALTAGDTIDNTADVGKYYGVPKTTYDTGGFHQFDGPSDSVHLIVAKPDLSIVKTPDNGSAIAGQNSSFTVKVTNTDTHSTAHNVKVHDVLDAGLNYTPGTATASPSAGFSETGAAGQTIDWKIATLGPGASVTITVPVGVGASVAQRHAARSTPPRRTRTRCRRTRPTRARSRWLDARPTCRCVKSSRPRPDRAGHERRLHDGHQATTGPPTRSNSNLARHAARAT